MIDREIYEKFMLWMGMKPSKTKVIGENTVVMYSDYDENTYNPTICDDRFTKVGYDFFSAGVVFDKDGKIVRAYVDSHSAYASDNYIEIRKMLED
jgi:hypothetical protein